MDFYDRLAAVLTDHYLQNRDLVDTAIKGLSWGATVMPYLDAAFQYAEPHIDSLEPLHNVEDGVDYVFEDDSFKQGVENFEQLEEPLRPENADESLTGPDHSVEIGGPQVDADIAEIKELQEKQEMKRADQASDMAERREQLADKYADSPQQQEYLDQFDDAAKAADEALVAQQTAELHMVPEQQQVQQTAELQPPPPPPPPPPML